MKVISSASELPYEPTIRTGFVPTMGALHEGHLSLIRRSAQENQRTIVSIFVNPTQFGPNEDFSRYPRPFEEDCLLAEQAGADIVFAPQKEDLYGEHNTMIHVPFVSDLFEGAIRPGHFDGVATVVAKFFILVRPTVSYFGEKDLQQCAVINKLVSDLHFPIKIIISDTLRESDGLALSSRNRYLSESERQVAPLIYQCLTEAKQQLLDGLDSDLVLKAQSSRLEESGFQVDYFALVDRCIMQPISTISPFASLITAARLQNTRLIDNIRVVG